LSRPPARHGREIDSSPLPPFHAGGLSSAEADERLSRDGPNDPSPHAVASSWRIAARQFSSPLSLLLIVAAVVSAFLRQPFDAAVVLVIVLSSGALGFWQERGASRSLERLVALVSVLARVRRDGAAREVPAARVVVGDVVELSAGDAIPADAVLFECRGLHVDESTLTGESFPAEKRSARPDESSAATESMLSAGTHVVSGSGVAVVTATGMRSRLAHLARDLHERGPTAFERTVTRFGAMVLELTMLLVLLLVIVNVALGRPWLESTMFALALAVGLTPQLLPAIVGTTLARGARQMAEEGVVVRRLAALEEFGSMSILLTDKTGTVTKGEVEVVRWLDPTGEPAPRVLELARINAALESGFVNPLDHALRQTSSPPLPAIVKLDEVPYDFIRRRIAILAEVSGERLLVVKGALREVLAVCETARVRGRAVPIDAVRDRADALVSEAGAAGMRAIAVASRTTEATAIDAQLEQQLVLEGVVLLSDPIRPEAAQTMERLRQMGLEVKLVSGDGAAVVRQIGRLAGLRPDPLITGSELESIGDAALSRRMATTDLFAEIAPHQKARLVQAARRSGRVTGFIGDGINDAPALRAADIGISVDSAADVAKEAADVVLMRRGLSTLSDGVSAGRSVVANTFKYVFMATGANFGNMFSMACAAAFLPFLPMLPMQVLLTNLLTDIPEMTIATDRVDPELTERPRRWNLGFVRRFMLVFGLTSSLFDLATFTLLRWLFHADAALFHTGWFIESVTSASLAVLSVRTRRSIWSSRPSAPMLVSTLAVVSLATALPFLPFAGRLGFVPPRPGLLATIALVVATYLLSVEGVKRLFYRRERSA
jgi:Mg2+-importing ATPase